MLFWGSLTSDFPSSVWRLLYGMGFGEKRLPLTLTAEKSMIHFIQVPLWLGGRHRTWVQPIKTIHSRLCGRETMMVGNFESSRGGVQRHPVSMEGVADSFLQTSVSEAGFSLVLF